MNSSKLKKNMFRIGATFEFTEGVVSTITKYYTSSFNGENIYVFDNTYKRTENQLIRQIYLKNNEY